MSFHAVVLAAGRGSRMGAPKHLLEIDGKPMLAHVVAALCRSQVQGITVVLRPDDAVGAALAESLGAKPVWAEAAQEGRAASIRAGVRAGRGAPRRSGQPIGEHQYDAPAGGSGVFCRL